MTTSKISIIKGDDTTMFFTFTENGAALNLTGYKVYFTVKKELDDTDSEAVIKKDWTSHIDPANGKTQIKLTKTETDVTPGQYVWDHQIKSSLGDIASSQYGECEVIQDVTIRTD